MNMRPRRLTPPAVPGSLLKTAAALAQQPRIPPEKGGPLNYLALVRLLPCLYCGVEPCGEAAHVKFASSEFGRTNALGKRPHDKDAVPLCGEDHRLARHAQHNGNEEAFWLALGIDPYFTAKRLYEKRGDLVAMRFVAVEVIANRDKR